MKTIINCFVISFILISFQGLPQNRGEGENIIYPGETLIYSVKWMFIRVGTITVKTTSYQENPDYIKVSMMVESNPAIFFISVEEYNETLVEIKNCMSKEFYGKYKNGSGNLIIKSIFNETNSSASYSVYDDESKQMIKNDSIFNSPRYVDGPSLFLFTRIYSRFNSEYNVPTMIDGKINNTQIVFDSERAEMEIDAFPDPVKARKYSGLADWEGGSSQSLSGEFIGWISDDDSAVPLYSEVKVLLGKIKIELEHQYKSSLVPIIRAAQNN
jgi:hypothetical protein